MKKRIFIIILVLLLGGLFIQPKTVYGQKLGSDLGKQLKDLSNTPVNSGSGGQALKEITKKVTRIAMPAAVIAIIILFSYAAVLMVVSQGNPEKLQEVRKILVNAILGFIMIALATSILAIITDTLQL